MPHGGYHGEVKIGDTVIQQASTPDGQGGHTGGGIYKKEGWDDKPSTYDPSDHKPDFGSDPDDKKAAQQYQGIIDAFNEKKEKKAATSRYRNEILHGMNLSGASGSQTGGGIGAEELRNMNFDLARQGLTGDEYFDWRQQLLEANPQVYQQAHPWASGKGLADIIKMATPLKYLGMATDWGQEKLGQGVDWATQGLGDIYENITEEGVGEAVAGGTKDVWEDIKGLKNMPGEFLNLLPGISGHAQGGIVETMPDHFHDYSRGI